METDDFEQKSHKIRKIYLLVNSLIEPFIPHIENVSAKLNQICYSSRIVSMHDKK